MAFIRGPDGKMYDYGFFCEEVKPAWKTLMAEEQQKKKD